tara:strand:- start:229 stop:444 length:216 start_codon:yes stop_codon:yes gene_type:complete
MKRVVLASLILINTSPFIVFSQPFQIPVIPYEKKPLQVSYKIHNRCKRAENYWKCIAKSDQKVNTSLDMDD